MLNAAQVSIGEPALQDQLRWSKPIGRAVGDLGLPVRNELVRDLPDVELERLQGSLRPFEFRRRQVLQASNVPIHSVYFIEEGSAALQCRSGANGESLHVAHLGPRDFVGVPLVLGIGFASNSCVALEPGEALCTPADAFRGLLSGLPMLHRRLLAYAHVLFAEASQIALCSNFHPVEQRLARLLLTASPSCEEVPFTHKELAAALGVRRASVSDTLGAWQKRGIVELGRSRISLVRGDALQSLACSCLARIERQRSRLTA